MSDFKSSVKFLIHRNKIFNYLKKINIDSLEGTFEETIQHLDNIKTNIYSFLKLLGYYDIIMTFNEFNTIFLIKFHNDVIISYETENSENVLNSVNKLVSCMKNFDIYDNLCVLKIINRFNNLKNFPSCLQIIDFVNKKKLYKLNSKLKRLVLNN